MSAVLTPQAAQTASEDAVELLLVEMDNVVLSPADNSRRWVAAHIDIGHLDVGHVDSAHTDSHSDDQM